MEKTNTGLYDYIVEHYKLFRNIGLGLVVFLLAAVLKYYPEVFSDQNLAYYLFSTIVQGFMALVGFLGSVVIFKLQLLESDSSNITEATRSFTQYYIGSAAQNYSPTEMFTATEKILNMKEPGGHIDRIQSTHDRLKTNFNEKAFIKNRMIDFALISLVNVGLALIGIMLSKVLIFHELYLLNSIYSFIVIFLSLTSLFIAFLLIEEVMGYSFGRSRQQPLL